jgi:hypothetical protein
MQDAVLKAVIYLTSAWSWFEPAELVRWTVCKQPRVHSSAKKKNKNRVIGTWIALNHARNFSRPTKNKLSRNFEKKKKIIIIMNNSLKDFCVFPNSPTFARKFRLWGKVQNSFPKQKIKFLYKKSFLLYKNCKTVKEIHKRHIDVLEYKQTIL